MTMAQLKRRANSKFPQRKEVRQRIEAEKKRVCGFKDCTESLAFHRGTTRYCSTSHKKREEYRLKSYNKKKKDAYNKRHGIVRTTIKRTVKASINAIDPKGYDLIYENYKEPLKKIPKADGFGYYGTVATTADKELVQCHLCGNLFKSLGVHIAKHNLTARTYKEKYGLGLRTALIGDATREKMQRNTVKIYDGKLPEHLRKYNEAGQPNATRGKGSKSAETSGWTLERRNKEGLCPDQVIEKIKEAAEKLGHTPSYDEFKVFYHTRYVASIRYLHGNYLNAVKKARLISAKELKEPSNETILRYLVEFKEEHGHIPMTSDFKRGLLPVPRQMYNRRFGNLNNARLEAGLNAVLPMPFGQIIEVNAEQYAAYKNGHGISDAAIRGRKKRAKAKELKEMQYE